MLTDAALKCLKPKAKMYKVTDRDGMYVRRAVRRHLVPARLPAERWRETVHLGYARDGISLPGHVNSASMRAGRSPMRRSPRSKSSVKAPY